MVIEGMMRAGNTKVVGGHVLKVAYIKLLANLTYCIMMKMLSRNLQNNGDEFGGGLWRNQGRRNSLKLCGSAYVMF